MNQIDLGQNPDDCRRISRTLSAATQHQNTDFSVWEGLQVEGAVVHTLARGRHVLADGELSAEVGDGRYLSRKPFGPVYQGIM